MALSIYNNIYSMNAQKSLTMASNAQGKSLERLSSGLRINSAADDASGLAISEKLRGQIKGLKRATMNAQDGISYLQTAEGGMEEVTNMLQRMREIAVQAGNGIYTTNDRAMLQLEVDQLKEEVNRISRTTEFNTKKLLNGDGTAVWSADKEFLGAIVRGPEVAEGNYKIDTEMIPGTNTKYKTEIMSVNKGVLVAEVTGTGAGMNMGSVRDPSNINLTGVNDMNISVGSNIAARTQADINNQALSSLNTYKQDGSNWTVSSANVTMGAGGKSGFYEMEMTGSGPTSAAMTFRYRVMDSKTGQMSNWITGTSVIGANGSATFTLTLSAVASAGSSIALQMPSSGDIQKGDKILGTFAPEMAAAAATAAWTVSGGGTIRVGDGPVIDYPKKGELTKADNGDAKEDFNKVKVHMGQMDPKTGVVDYGSITLEFKENTVTANATTPGVGSTISGVATMKVRDEGAAAKDTKLSDIASFTNSDGRNILANTQELKMYADGKMVSIFLESDDTIEDFTNKMTAAFVDKLGVGADGTTRDGQIVNQNLIKYVPNLHNTDNSGEAVPGTFVIQTAMIGDNSDLVFVGDQGLIDALGLAVIQKGQNSSMDVKVTDAHTGKFIGKDNVNDGRLRNVIHGVDVTLEQNSGVDVTWNTASKTMEFTPNALQSSGYLHVVDNRTELQIGANQGQTMNISVGQLDTTGLEIDDIYVMDMDLSQKAITKLDKAIEQLNSTRATIGAQVNRLEYTINNLETARENLTAAESRIRDLDIASETAEFSKNQILVQASTAMVAQANQVPQNALTLLKGL